MQSPRRIPLAMLCLATVVAAHRVAADPQKLSITFKDNIVSADGVQPGSQVVFFGVGLQPTGYDSFVTHWRSALTDTDRDGHVDLLLSTRVPWKSIWFVADLKSGQYGVGAPDGFPIRERVLRPNSFRRRGSGLLDEFVSSSSFIDFLYVEPNRGAWAVEARDGYDSDNDGQSNGEIAVSLDRMASVTGDQSHSREFSASGTVVAIDFSKMEITISRVPGGVQ